MAGSGPTDEPHSHVPVTSPVQTNPANWSAQSSHESSSVLHSAGKVALTTRLSIASISKVPPSRMSNVPVAVWVTEKVEFGHCFANGLPRSGKHTPSRFQFPTTLPPHLSNV